MLSPLPERRRLLPGLLCLGLGMLAAAPYAGQFHSGLNDEGVVLAAAERLVLGQVPYRDFDLFYPPGSMLATAAWWSLTGTSYAGARLLMVLGCGLLTTLTFLLADRWLNRPMAFLPPLLLAVSGFSEWPIISYHWFAIGCLLAGMIPLVDWIDRPHPARLLAAGLGIGLAGACLQSEGVVGVLVACLVVLTRRGPRWRNLGYGVLGVAAVWVPLLLGLAALQALRPMVDDVVLRAVGGLYAHHSAPYNPNYLLQVYRDLAAQWPGHWGPAQGLWAAQALPMVGMLTLKYGLFLPVLGLTAWLAARRGGRWQVLAALSIIWPVLRHERLDLLYSNYLMPIWYLGLALILETLQGRRHLFRLTLGAILALYLSIVAADVLYLREFSHRLLTPGGTLWGRDPGQTGAEQTLYARAFQLTPPGQSAFAWPFSCAFYVLSGTHNPSRLDFVVPGWHTREEATRVARALAEQKVPYLYYFPLDPDFLRYYPSLDPQWFFSELEAMKGIITADYVEGERAGPAIVYRRRPEL